ncbi:MAG: N-acetylglucosamine-6-phosphate deacetylase [Eubacteriales bacterium]
MTTRVKSSRIILKDRLFSGFVYFKDDKITAVTADDLPFDREFDVGEKYVSPGFIDLHTHGGGGYDFTGSIEDVINGCNFHLFHGTTSICPTLSAAPFEEMARGVKNVYSAMHDGRTQANIIGAHLEGPYLSPAQSGAQSPDCITPPVKDDYVPLVENYKDAIARWSYAPELDENGEFCKYISDHGVIPSAGHTDAVYDDMQRAIRNGCKTVTHLYSCTSTITRDHGYRILGVIETALLCDELYVEIIADGKHLPPNLIRLILKNKGSDRVLLVTDSLSLAGTDVRQGRMVNTEFIIEDGVCRLIDRSAFAGSIATGDRCIQVMTQEVGLSVPEAVKMMSAVPAEVMGLNKGEIAPGRDADIIVFDDDIRVTNIWIMGQPIVRSKRGENQNSIP